jgi:hypothetical protein
MRKAIFAIAAAATIAVGTLSIPTTADAGCRGCGIGIGVGAGILGAAIVGSAIANSQPGYYGPQPGYVIYNGYGAPYPVNCPSGYWARRPVRDGYGNVVGWGRPRFICP